MYLHVFFAERMWFSLKPDFTFPWNQRNRWEMGPLTTRHYGQEILPKKACQLKSSLTVSNFLVSSWLTWGKNGAMTGPVTSSSLSRVTTTFTVEPLKQPANNKVKMQSHWNHQPKLTLVILRMSPWWSLCTFHSSHARWSYHRWLGSLLLWACVQCHDVWHQLFERNYFPLFVDSSSRKLNWIKHQRNPKEVPNKLLQLCQCAACARDGLIGWLID